MKKKFYLAGCALFCLASMSAFGAQPNSFSLLGIQLGQPKSALESIGKFDCRTSDNPNYNEFCYAQLTVDSYSVLILASLNNNRVTGLQVIHKHPGHNFFETSVQTATRNYGDPQRSSKHVGSELLVWRLANQQYSISTSASDVTIAIDDFSVPPPPPAPPKSL